MIIYKTFFKVLNKCKFPIILYTVLLLFFAGVNMTSNNQSMDFTAEKPDIMIVNNDMEEGGLTGKFMDYLRENTNIRNDIASDEQSIKDALFYRDIQYILYIPEHYGKDMLDGKNPQLKYKTTGEYQSSLASMITERYVKVANNYILSRANESDDELYSKINDTLSKKANVEITSKLDTYALGRLTRYYNFSAYSFIAISIYVISTILLIFREEKIYKRTIVGSTDYKKINAKLLIASSGFCFLVWLFYVIMAKALIGDVAFGVQGLYMMVNSFIFVISTVTLGFFVSKFVKSKNTITAFVNIIGLGSSFLCGVFVPMQYLPSFVLKIAHVLPAYWFVKNNELIGETEVFTGEVIKSLGINALVMIAFAMVFFMVCQYQGGRRRLVRIRTNKDVRK